MKKLLFGSYLLGLTALFAFTSLPKSSIEHHNYAKADFKLGVQMWTFRMFTFTDALNKVDSSGIKDIEQYMGQKLGGDMQGNFGLDMSAQDRA